MGIAVQVSLVALSVILTGCPSRNIEENPKIIGDLYTLDTCVKMFKLRAGRLPSADEGLNALIDGKLLAKVPDDPWGHPYRYVTSAANERGYDIYSLGPDRESSFDDIHLK